ncbi:MAG: hypothetical protein AAB414_00205 [Patescibacteria group bacterium]
MVIDAENRYPNIPLNEEFDIQRELIFEGVTRVLGMNKDDCFKVLPAGFPTRKPEFDELGVDTPILVPKFEQVTVWQLAEAVGFKINRPPLYPFATIDIEELQDPRGINLPEQSYGTWLHVGDKYNTEIRDNKERLLTLQLQARGEHHEPEYVTDLLEGRYLSRYVNCLALRKLIWGGYLGDHLRLGNHWDGLGLSITRPDLKTSEFHHFFLIGSDATSGLHQSNGCALLLEMGKEQEQPYFYSGDSLYSEASGYGDDSFFDASGRVLVCGI